MRGAKILSLCGFLCFLAGPAQADFWAERIGGTGIDRVNAVATDAEGNVYVTGAFTGTVSIEGPDPDRTDDDFQLVSQGSQDIFVGKLDRHGNWLWAVSEGGSGAGDEGFGVTVDDAGNAYITGSVEWPASGAPASPTGVTLDRQALVFTTGNWDNPQTVRVTAVDDGTTGSKTAVIPHVATSEDADYQGPSANLSVSVRDNDAPGVVIVETDGSTDVREEGPGASPTSDTYRLLLNAEPDPLEDVTVTVTPDAQVDLGSGPGVAVPITFPSGTWGAPQTVTVTAVDDAVVDDPDTATITHSATGGGYDAVTIPNVVANVADDEELGVTIYETDGTTAVWEEGPTSDTYSVVLNALPAADVTVTVTPDADVDLGSGEGIAINLTFTPATWHTPQTVTVTAFDDSAIEGTQPATITHSASQAGGGGYDAVTIPDVTVTVTDNDAAGIRIVQTGASTSVWEEGPTYADYDVTLAAPPGDKVIVLLGPSPSAFVAKLDPDGVWEWAEPLAIGAAAAGNDIVLGDSGKLYVAGTASETATVLGDATVGAGDDVFVSKISQSSGSVDWAVRDGTAGDQAGNGIAYDGVANLYVAGYFPSDGNNPPTTVEYARQLPITTPRAFTSIVPSATGDRTGRAVALDDSGNLYVVGEITATAAPFLRVKTSSWTDWSVGAAGTGALHSVVLDSAGTVFASGDQGGEMTVTRWESGGSAGPEWIATAGSSAAGRGLALSPDEEVLYVGGSFTATVTFAAGDASQPIPSAGGEDGILARADAAGGDWVQRFAIALLPVDTPNPNVPEGAPVLRVVDEPDVAFEVGTHWFAEGTEIETGYWSGPAPYDDIEDIEPEMPILVDTEGTTTTGDDYYLAYWQGTDGVFVPREDRSQPPTTIIDFEEGGESVTVYPTYDDHYGQEAQVTITVTDDGTFTWFYRETESLDLGNEFPPPEYGGVALQPTLYATPGVDFVERPVGIGESEGFLWHTADSQNPRLYPTSPGVAEVSWKRAVDGETEYNHQGPLHDQRMRARYHVVWPDDTLIHVTGLPVNLEPADNGWTYGLGWTFFESQTDGSATGAQIVIEATAGQSGEAGINFDADVQSGNDTFSLLLFTEGEGSNITNAELGFAIVRTVVWDDPDFADPFFEEVDLDIGSPVERDEAQAVDAEDGYVLFERAPYDPALYDRETRVGTIVPVNENIDGLNHDLVVIWYDNGTPQGFDNEQGLTWPVKWSHYTLQWPADADTIVIASGEGSGELEAHEYGGDIYHQPDPTLPGFNPNDEHALIRQRILYALRPDLNERSCVEALDTLGEGADPAACNGLEPHVLLKYQDPETDEWVMRVFNVVAEDGSSDLAYDVTAGKPIVAPTPLNLLAQPPETYASSGADCYHRDHRDGHWAKSAVCGTIEMRWYYPLQPGFYYPDYDLPDGPDAADGEAVPFLNDRALCTEPGDGTSVPAFTDGTFGRRCEEPPIAVPYTLSWPQDVPVLYVGETLTGAKYGLPDLVNMAAAQVIFDENAHSGKGPLAKLYDPFSPRSVCLDGTCGTDLPEDIMTENFGGRLKLVDLPYSLRSRVFFDPINRTLSFEGFAYDPGIGEPLLLPNVMTEAERERLKTLSPETGAWTGAVDALFELTRDPNGIGALEGDETYEVTNPYSNAGTLVLNSETGSNRFDDVWGIGLGLERDVDDAGNWLQDSARNDAYFTTPQKLVGLPMGLTAGMAQATGYLVLVENDDESLGSAPVTLHVLRVEGGPYRGEIKVIKSDNLFDDKLTLRHTGDFAGEPERVYFQWYIQPDRTGIPPPLPVGDELGDWDLWDFGWGNLDTTIEGSTTLQALSDNWFVVRYYYGNAYRDLPFTIPPVDQPPAGPDDNNNWSRFAGSPGGETAQLAEGWIKRVFGDLNPFEARVKDFREAPVNTNVSIVAQLGERYEGDIALNGSAENLNQMGLIEGYETVSNRGQEFSIDAGHDYGPANNALLNAATRIADFYTLLGNESYNDALDPTIGFDTRTEEYGSASTSLFAFQNQLASLLEEELNLLRGRDNALSTTRARPIYNRLVWNFTQGDGEVAYVQTYNLSDQDGSGIIDELDGKAMYPQGHGDAWGHYLTAMKTWYQLIRHENFTWEPRVESVLVGGAPIPVDYMDERNFATTAAAKAKVGVEIVNLTYRAYYVEDPAGQWQGYKDTDAERAWGVDEWARRAAQGAYFDWAVANAMLPAEDPNPDHTGIQIIDRGHVPELKSIASEAHSLQIQIDRADQGLNPLGLADGVVPFDIDPTFLEVGSGIQGEVHFDQVYDRALNALENAKTVFDYANAYTQRLRGNEDTLVSFKRDVQAQERDYWNQLITLFGYPYPEDIGPNGTYPPSYDGPDLYHYMYVERSDLTGQSSDALHQGQLPNVVGPASAIPLIGELVELLPLIWGGGRQFEPITYHVSADGFGLQKPSDWTGSRRATGELQVALSELYQARVRLQKAREDYFGLVDQMWDWWERFEAQRAAFGIDLITKQGWHIIRAILKKIGTGTEIVAVTLEKVEEGVEETAGAGAEAVPQNAGFTISVGGPVKGAVKLAGALAGVALDAGQTVAVAVEKTIDETLGFIDKEIEILLEGLGTYVELWQKTQEFEDMVRQESGLRFDVLEQAEALQQAMGRFRDLVAQGERLLAEVEQFRKNTAADIQDARYQDLAFRLFRNEAVQKYRATFDLASRYAYLAATAYDYETNLLGGAAGAGMDFLTDIVRERSIGEIIDGRPVTGPAGLADALARLKQNFDVYNTQLGLNNPQLETNRFSLRTERFRIRAEEASNPVWTRELQKYVTADLWQIPEFRNYCRSFALEPQGPQPGIVIPFSTEIQFGRNFFGWPLSGGDSTYDPSLFATKIFSVGVWFTGYDETQLSYTPRVYLVPVGADVLRSPAGEGFATRDWVVVDQKLPVPFPISEAEVAAADWIPLNDSLSEGFGNIRRHSSFRAFPDNGEFDPGELILDTRLVGRSVWNRRWALIIPGGTLLADPDEGIDRFIDDVTDIKLYFQTYSFSGN